MKNNQGFTLIELMIVVEIIAIIIVIALPSFLRTRLQANESAAVGSLKVILEAQATYHTDQYTYSDGFEDLTGVVPPYLSGSWDEPKNGYIYTVTGDQTTFIAQAVPEKFGSTGWHGFMIDQTGVFRYELNAAATEASPVLGG